MKWLLKYIAFFINVILKEDNSDCFLSVLDFTCVAFFDRKSVGHLLRVGGERAECRLRRFRCRHCRRLRQMK